MEPVQKEVILCCLEHHHNIIDEIIQDLRVDECVFDIKLILHEAITNAHYHGNNRDCKKRIYVRYILKDKHLNIQVEDCGDGVRKLIFPERIDNLHLLDEGGRGLYLIRCLSDNVEMINNTIYIDKNLSNPII